MKFALFALSIIFAAPKGMAQQWILQTNPLESCRDVCEGENLICDVAGMEAVNDMTKAAYVMETILGLTCSGGIIPGDDTFNPSYDPNSGVCSYDSLTEKSCTDRDSAQSACCCIPVDPEAGVCPVEASAGGAGGDPHFKTWTGKKFDFHGECDLVLIDHPQFANGLGMKLHIRTTRDRFFSYIERAALQIGPDVLEFGSSKDWTINGKDLSSERKATLGEYEVWVFPNAVSVRLDKSAKAKIDFISRKSGTPYVFVDGSTTKLFMGSRGMMGDYVTGDMLKRDGVTMEESPVEFAREWQVNPLLESNIFQTERSPVYPESCKMPQVDMPPTSRLGSTHMAKAAEEACESWGEDKEECVFDVMATRDIRAAQSLVGVHWNRASKDKEIHDSIEIQ